MVCGLWFVVCGLWFVVCGLWFVVARAGVFVFVFVLCGGYSFCLLLSGVFTFEGFVFSWLVALFLVFLLVLGCLFGVVVCELNSVSFVL